MYTKTLPSLAVTLLLVACSSSEPAEESPLRSENRGVGTRQGGSLTIAGAEIGRTTVEFDGAYDAGTPEADFVRCSYGNDPDAIGQKRVVVTLGYTGRLPAAEVKLLDWDAAAPREVALPFVVGRPRQSVDVTVRRSIDGGDTAVYRFREDVQSVVRSYCYASIDEFSGAQLSGFVACSDLLELEDGRPSISATITFDCPLSDAPTTSDPIGVGGGNGSGGGSPLTCEDGATRECLGEEACEGLETCSGGEFGACVCPEGPNLLLKLLTPSDAYEGIVDQATGSYLEDVAQSMASQGYVVTAGVANSAPYTLWGVRPVGSTTKYEAILSQTTGSYLEDVVANMASSGYVPTVGMANTVPYSIIGVRPVGSTDVYETQMAQTDGNGLDGVLSSMGAAGYVPLIGMANTVPYTIIGVRKQGSKKTYTTSMIQTVGSGLSSSATSLTSAGYVITIAMQNSVPYTIVGVRDATKDWSLSALVDQTIGSGLDGLHASFSSSGFAVLAATGEPTPYTFYGTKITTD